VDVVIAYRPDSRRLVGERISLSGRLKCTDTELGSDLVGVDSALLFRRRNRGGDSGGLIDGDGGNGIVGIEYSFGNA
jgi:hypothetical protein